MRYLPYKLLTCFIAFITFLLTNTLNSQNIVEFPVEVGPDSTLALTLSEDPNQFLIIMRKELPNNSGAEIIGQFVSKEDHSVLNMPVVFGSTTVPLENFVYAIPQVAYDGKRHLVIWSTMHPFIEQYVTYGRFIDPATYKMSDSIIIWNRCAVSGMGTLKFDTLTHMFISVAYQPFGSELYARLIDTNGIIKDSVMITIQNTRHEYSIGSLDSLYLVCWINDEDDSVIWGQLLDKNCRPTWYNFIIDDTRAYSDNPIYTFADNNKFWVLYTDHAGISNTYNLYCKFVYGYDSTSPRVLISDNGYLIPHAIVNDTTVLISWTRYNPSIFKERKIRARFFNLDASAIGEEFTVFAPDSSKYPFGNYVAFANNNYYAFTTRVMPDEIGPGQGLNFNNGDVYGAVILRETAVKYNAIQPIGYKLYQNYPNPFNPTTTISFNLSCRSFVTLKVYDLLGREIETLIFDVMNPGNYSVNWHAGIYSSGIYIYRLTVNGYTDIRKMVFMK